MSKLTPPININDHVQGPPDGTVTLVEYGDYECPHCGAAFPILKQVQKAFVKNLRFAFRHFPLSNVHEYAFPAAIAAEAAGKQGKFWEMHDMIFERQSLLQGNAFLEFAKEVGLNIPAFKMDLQDPMLGEKVEADFESGVRSGVNGTPSFFVNGDKYHGPFDYASLASAVEEKMRREHVTH
jgi:protein-disulfide isomerase